MVREIPDDLPPAYFRIANAGESVYRQGDPGGEMYVVESGRVELTTVAGVGTAMAGPGDVFGELSALEGCPRESDARALEDSRLLRIDGPTLEAMVRREPGLGLSLLARLARRSAQAFGVTPAPAPEPAAASGTPRLCDPSGVDFPLPEGDEVVVGRRSGQVVPDLDLTTVDTQRSLSRRHARIVRSGSAFALREEPGVLNGTFLNGARLKAGESPPLKSGDEVGFGLVKLVFRI